MKSRNHNIDDLSLQANLQGEATQKQKDTLLLWLNVSEENKNLYKNMRKIWLTSDKLHVFSLIDENKDWKRIQAKRKPIKKISFGWIKYAAVIFISLGLSFFYLNQTTPGFGKYAQIKSTIHIETFTLEDSSCINLNKNSKLIYPKKFDSKQRSVKLIGEAFFKIKHNSNKAFIIESGDAIIKVLGTSFNIKNLNDHETIVSVKTGVVSFSLNNSETGLILKTGEVALLKNNKIIKLKGASQNL